MNIFFLIIFISNIFVISPNYTYEIIEELIPKTIIFDTKDLYFFKIFKYIPLCQENENYKKDIYLQTLSKYHHTTLIYIYDDFSKIAQNNNFKFINYINYFYINTLEISFLFSDLNCKKEYFFVLSYYYDDYSHSDYPEFSGILFNIIDAKIDIINLTPELSDIFSFHQRNKTQREIIFYSHKEKKNCLINFSIYAKIQIFKNGDIIYEKKEDEYKKEILFEKNENYTIYFMGYNNNFFSLQLFNETPILKYDLKNGPIALYYSPIYYFEIDISQFEVDDIILLYFCSSSIVRIKYQYKSKFKGNNFNFLGIYKRYNYIPIKNTIKDSSLIISIENTDDFPEFTILNFISDKIGEINLEFKKEIKGPKYYFIDYNKFNNMNSIGFLANESFFIHEEKKEEETSILSHYHHFFITTLDSYAVNTFKSAIIYFNSSNNILFEVKKYNYPFLDKLRSRYFPNYDYYQLCQGKDTLDEIYFFLENYNIFQPVFGSFYSYFIRFSNIKTSSDLDFDNKELSSYYREVGYLGFLKIKCNSPLMLKHIYMMNEIFDGYVLNSGQKYYLDLNRRKHYTFDESLINKDFQIKISLFGLEPNQSIKFFFNNITYNLTNKLFELNFTYKNYSSDLFHFEIMEENSNYTIIAEINVGFLSENINKAFKQIDFIDSFGTLNIKEEEGVIIKIPKTFTKDLFNFSIIFNEFIDSNSIYIDISYDKIEFQTICYELKRKAPLSIPLFRENPYKYVESNLLDSYSNNKFFYILIYSDYAKTIYIRKPLMFSDINCNTIYYLPKLTGNNSIYYYQIEYPKIDRNYSYLAIQIPVKNAIGKALSKQNIHYPFLPDYYEYYFAYLHYFFIPLDKREKNNVEYFNYYTDNDGYINFIQTNENSYPYKKSLLSKFIRNIQQINGKNELIIELNSLSYKYNNNNVKYYLYINIHLRERTDFSYLYSIIIGHIKPNETNQEFMIILEDNGLNEIFSKEIGINIDLNNGNNKILIIPIFNNTNLILEDYIRSSEFNFKNIPRKDYKALLYILIPIIALIIIIFVIFIILKYRKKTNKKGITIEKIKSEELISLEK